MLYLKPLFIFSLNFSSLFLSWEITLLYFFSWNFIKFLIYIHTIWTKVTHQSAEFETLDSSYEISPNLYFDRFLLLKLYKISAKKVQRSFVLWHLRVMQNLKKKQFSVSKITIIWSEYTKLWKICTSIGLLYAKYIIFA